MKIYRVYDTQENTYWSNRKGKTTWNTPAAAKNAWNVVVPGLKDPVFNQQTRFIVKENILDDKNEIVDIQQLKDLLKKFGTKFEVVEYEKAVAVEVHTDWGKGITFYFDKTGKYLKVF